MHVIYHISTQSCPWLHIPSSEYSIQHLVRNIEYVYVYIPRYMYVYIHTCLYNIRILYHNLLYKSGKPIHLPFGDGWNPQGKMWFWGAGFWHCVNLSPNESMPRTSLIACPSEITPNPSFRGNIAVFLSYIQCIIFLSYIQW